MSIFYPKLTPEFRTFADLQLRRHEILIAGNSEDSELNEIEEKLTILWDNLDETQRQSGKGMSSDQNIVRRNGLPPPMAGAPEAVTPEEIRVLESARESNE